MQIRFDTNISLRSIRLYFNYNTLIHCSWWSNSEFAKETKMENKAFMFINAKFWEYKIVERSVLDNDKINNIFLHLISFKILKFYFHIHRIKFIIYFHISNSIMLGSEWYKKYLGSEWYERIQIFFYLQ